jgi:hypothetical protein
MNDQEFVPDPLFDSEMNLSWAMQFNRNAEDFLPLGMRIKIGNSDTERNTMVQITYQHPRFGNPYPNQAYSIPMRQSQPNFIAEFKKYFLITHKIAREIAKQEKNEGSPPLIIQRKDHD